MASECRYWRLSDAFANGDAEMLEMTEVPCTRCIRCRQASSDGVLIAFDELDEETIRSLMMSDDGYVADQSDK